MTTTPLHQHQDVRHALTRKETSSDQQHTRQRAFEIVLVGVSIGMAVVLIRTITQSGSHWQWTAFVVAAVLLTIIHYVLRGSVRRISSVVSPRRLRQGIVREQNDLFAGESDQRWTGLSQAGIEQPELQELQERTR